MHRLNINDLGHTVLDSLMIAVLKGHTSCMPVMIDPAMADIQPFMGEDTDICGRWDADSDCVRKLRAHGNAKIPFRWKHKFCHTSIQAICHSITLVFIFAPEGDLNRPSGLFGRRCSYCGLKLQMTGFDLARVGCDGGDLFGITACLLCLLALGVNPCLKAGISLQALLNDDDGDQCNHQRWSPVELAECIPTATSSTWLPEVKTGWRLFCNILRRAHNTAESKTAVV